MSTFQSSSTLIKPAYNIYIAHACMFLSIYIKSLNLFCSELRQMEEVLFGSHTKINVRTISKHFSISFFPITSQTER